MLPPVLVTRAGWQPTFVVHVPTARPSTSGSSWRPASTAAASSSARTGTRPARSAARPSGEATFAVPGDLPLGYHWVHAQTGDRLARMSLVVTPPWVGMPARLGGRPHWGLATQLYSVRSRRLLGHRRPRRPRPTSAAAAAVGHGADYVLVNPLHAAEPVAPMEPSPYLPTSRRFVNPLYLRPELDPGVRRPVGRRPRGRVARAPGGGRRPDSPSGSTATPPGPPSARRCS